MQELQLTEAQRVGKKCGKTPNSCNCEECRLMCKRAPCIGTPKDIMALIENGFVDQLNIGIFLAGWPLGFPHPPVTMGMIKTKEEDGSCVFFNNGHCLLHAVNLKPTEGRLASCQDAPQYFQGSSIWATAQEWLLGENEEIIDEILSRLQP